MLFYIFIGCVFVAWSVAWMASRRHVGGVAFVVIGGAVVTLVMQRAALVYFGYWLPEWAFPLTFVWDMMAMAACASYVWMTCEPVTVLGVAAYFRRLFADSRRRSSVRADVRRVAKQYRVEVL